MSPPDPDNEAMSEVRGKASHKQYTVLALDKTIPNLACFYKNLLCKVIILLEGPHTGLAF